MHARMQAVACARFLPAPLIAARAAVFDPLNCLDLNQTARRVLYGILTFLSARSPKKAIFPRRDTLRAESLLQSEPTLYRGLKLLEDRGYITRGQDRHARTGKFYLSPIQLTDKALVLLGLKRDTQKTPPIKVRDGHIKKELTNSKQSLQNTAGEPDASPIDRKTGLPAELVPLLDQGVKKGALCWLMKLARQRGKRLGEVVAAVWRRIGVLRGREVVAYLKAMLEKDLDFRWIAQADAVDQAQREEADAVRRQLEALDRRYDGYAVIGSSGNSVGIFEASGSGEHVIRTAGGAVPVNRRFAQALLEGKVRLQTIPEESHHYDERYR